MASAERTLFADAVFYAFFTGHLSGSDAYTTVGHAADQKENRKRGGVMNDFPMISYKQLDQWLEQGNVRLLADVREPWMYGENRILGSVNIPYEEVRERLEEFPRQGMIVCYCDRGAKSMVVCRDLWRLGYEVSDLAGGMLDYRGKYVDRRPLWDLK